MSRHPLLIGLSSLAMVAGCGDTLPTYRVADMTPEPATPPTTPDAPQARRLPISGGTLLVTRDGTKAVMADPDLDKVGVVDLGTAQMTASVDLVPGDEPGRLAEDAAGRIHVALRRGGAVVAIDPVTGKVLSRTAVCAAPRGIAYDAASDALHVACAGGELMTLPAAGGVPTRTVRLDRDLRDVIVDSGTLTVSTFRSAEVLTLDAQGQVATRRSMPSFEDGANTFAADVAWRMIGLPGGGVLLLHQRAQATPVPVDIAAPYAGQGPSTLSACIVHAAATALAPGALSPSSAAPLIEGVTLPVDVALSPDGTQVAVVSAGSGVVVSGPLTAIAPGASGSLTPTSGATMAVAAAFDPSGRLVIQTRAPSLLIGSKRVPLFGAAPTPAEATLGFDTFHQPPLATIACASCHPEGRDDGRVWSFVPGGLRRTQALAGGINDTAPFHWAGDETDLGDVIGLVYEFRMGGSSVDLPTRATQTEAWLATIPAPIPSPPDDPASVTRGQQLFEDPAVGCSTCHSGPKHTNNQTLDVGTGQAFQVPWLVGVAYRAPFLHDGCAATLADRFGACGGAKHGNTAQLTSGQIDDLVAFLEQL